MKALLVALLVSGVAFAEPPADAPVLVVKKGQFAPFDGVLMADAKAVEQAKRVVACEAEREELRKGGTSKLAIALFIVGAVVVGAGAGYGVAKLAK